MKIGHRAALPPPATPRAGEAPTYDPGDHTVAEVQAYVSEHPDELAQVYDAETAGRARSTLLAWLEAQ